MNVHELNKEKPENQDSYKSLQLLDEISKGEPLSQRDLSKKLNIALGLVNSYMKNLVSKGYITIKAIPAKRYTYYLTPKGFAEKTRLTYHHLQNFTNLYRDARRDFQKLFNDLHIKGVRNVVFAGLDEVAEIAYLSLQEIDIELAGVADDENAGKKFFKQLIKRFDELDRMKYDCVVITTFMKRDFVYQRLLEKNVAEDRINSIYDISAKGLTADQATGI
ncbi:MAG: winged helix-turn-helix transcriptional regulator [Nitrospirota bacterium]